MKRIARSSYARLESIQPSLTVFIPWGRECRARQLLRVQSVGDDSRIISVARQRASVGFRFEVVAISAMVMEMMMIVAVAVVAATAAGSLFG